MAQQLKGLPVHATAHLSIMETEAWFIAEHSHFPRVDSSLLPSSIETVLGYDPSAVDPENILSPASELHAAYQSAGLSYDKSRQCVERTVAALDMESIVIHVAPRTPSLSALICDVKAFLDE